MSDKPVIRIDFKRPPDKREGRRVWKDSRNGKPYLRFKHLGKEHRAPLYSTTKTKRQEEADALYSQFKLSTRGHADNPFLKTEVPPLNENLHKYIQAGCPKRNGKHREGKQLAHSLARLKNVMEKLGKLSCDKINNDVWRDYCARRCREIAAAGKHRTGKRSVELEQDDLFSAYRWMLLHPSQTGITAIPFSRMRWRDPDEIDHCREHQFASGDELHLVARSLFETPQSEVNGFVYLFGAFTGWRINEILKLRTDAAPKKAGHIRYKETKSGPIAIRLFAHRSKTHKGTFGYVDLSAPFRDLLDAHRNWLRRRYPNATYFFPNRLDPKKPVDESETTKALVRKSIEFDLRDSDGEPRHLTMHGARSGHANHLRSQLDSDGIPKFDDDYIASRLGHKSTKELNECYGERPEEPLSLMPSDPKNIAWLKWLPKKELQLELGL